MLGALPSVARAVPGDGSLEPEIPDLPWEAPAGGFDWSVPERFTQKADGRFNWRYDKASGRYDSDYVQPVDWPVDLYGCQSEDDAATPDATSNTYTFVPAHGEPVSGQRCAVQVRFPREGFYQVRMAVYRPDGSLLGRWEKTVVVKDLLIVSIGDSYASGEGAPEYRRQSGEEYGDWVDDRCHRSSYSGPAQAARALERGDPKTSVTFLSFACSGGNINREYLDWDPPASSFPIKCDYVPPLGLYCYDDPNFPWDPYRPGSPDKNAGSGILGPYRGAQPTDPDDYSAAAKMPSQIDQLRDALALDTTPADRIRQVDVLLLSAGGNDAGFGLLAMACVVQDDCVNPDVTFTDVDDRTKVPLATRVANDLAAMPARYDALADALTADGRLAIAATFITEYPDPGTERRSDSNEIEECEEIIEDIGWLARMEINGRQWGADRPWGTELGFARNVFLPGLNGSIRDAAQRNGWHYVGGISDGFRGHGYCVGANDREEHARFIQTAAMSAVYQGPDDRGKTKGTLHPNEQGYRVYRDRILDAVRPHVASVLPDGNVSYTFDTTPPTASASLAPAANGAGWHAGPVTVTVTAQAGGTNTLSHVEHQLDGGAWQRTSGSQATVAITGDGDHTLKYRAVDKALNDSSEGVTTLKIDTQDPTAVVTMPTEDLYLLGEDIAVAYRCDDDRSGVASCTGPVPSGGQLDTASAGAHSFRVDAVDNAGNDFSTVVPYRVAYDVCPLFRQDRSYKSGQAAPIRLQLCDANGGNASVADVLVTAAGLTKIDDSASTSVEDSGNSNPDGGFRYDDELGAYVFNLSTKGLSPGTWQLNFKATGDTTTHSVTFGVR
jgi:hypothetical protein